MAEFMHTETTAFRRPFRSGAALDGDISRLGGDLRLATRRSETTGWARGGGLIASGVAPRRLSLPCAGDRFISGDRPDAGRTRDD